MIAIYILAAVGAAVILFFFIAGVVCGIKARQAKKNIKLCEEAQRVWVETGDIDHVLSLELPKDLREALEKAKEEEELRSSVFPEFN
ncbi:MAG: hypothetical protein NC218_02270 [Acetobacter sp.]|nr:hypothetical protein [Acetobacter sp.]